MKHYAMYLRKSRADLEAEAHGEGETLARHQALLEETAQKLGISVEKIYREIVSGETISARPVMQQLLQDVEQNLWDGILVMEVERLARGDTIDQGLVARAFRYSFTAIITPLRTYHPWEEFDEEYFEFGLFMSRREYKTILRRMQYGRAASSKEGKYCGSRPPYGYSRKKLDGEKGYTLQPVEEEASVVQLIFSLAAGHNLPDGEDTRWGASKIAQHLTRLQIPTPSRNETWSSASVLGILHNPIYCGMIRWGARAQVKSVEDGQVIRHRPRNSDEKMILVSGRHPSLVEPSLWELAQKKISASFIPPIHKERTLQNPFAGILRCAECGHPLTRRAGKSGQADLLLCSSPNCPTVSSRLDYIETAVIESLNILFSDFCFPLAKQAHSSPTQTSILQNRLLQLNKTKEMLFELLESGIYSPKTFLERKQKNEQQIKQLQEVLAHTPETSPLPPRDFVIPGSWLSKIYQEMNPEQKNNLLKLLFAKIIYQKNQGGKGHQQDFSLTFFPLLPVQ